MNTSVVPVANHAGAQDRGAGHAGAPLPRPDLNGNAALSPAPSCDPDPDPDPVAGPAAPSSGEGHAPQLLPPMNLPASTPRVSESSGRAPNRTRAAGTPMAPARRRGRDTPAPQGDTVATERQNPIAMLATAAPMRQLAPAALLQTKPSQVALHRARPPLLRRRSRRPLDASWRMASMPAQVCRSIGRARRYCGAAAGGRRLGGWFPSRASDGAAGGARRLASSAPQQACRRLAGSLTCRRRSTNLGGPLTADFERRTAGAAAHTTREPVHSRHPSPPRRHIPAAVRRHIWLRDGGRCCYRDPLSGRRCTSSHLLQIDHLLPVAEGGGPEPSNLNL